MAVPTVSVMSSCHEDADAGESGLYGGQTICYTLDNKAGGMHGLVMRVVEPAGTALLKKDLDLQQLRKQSPSSAHGGILHIPANTSVTCRLSCLMFGCRGCAASKTNQVLVSILCSTSACYVVDSTLYLPVQVKGFVTLEHARHSKRPHGPYNVMELTKDVPMVCRMRCMSRTAECAKRPNHAITATVTANITGVKIMADGSFFSPSDKAFITPEVHMTLASSPVQPSSSSVHPPCPPSPPPLWLPPTSEMVEAMRSLSLAH